jgi:hypothetical protein
MGHQRTPGWWAWREPSARPASAAVRGVGFSSAFADGIPLVAVTTGLGCCCHPPVERDPVTAFRAQNLTAGKPLHYDLVIDPLTSQFSHLKINWLVPGACCGRAGHEKYWTIPVATALV